MWNQTLNLLERSQTCQPLGNTDFLINRNRCSTYVCENGDDWPRHRHVGRRIEERSRLASVATASSPTDAMDVVFDATRQVIVDDVVNPRDVETASGNGGRDENSSASSLEIGQGFFTLPLFTVAVNKE